MDPECSQVRPDLLTTFTWMGPACFLGFFPEWMMVLPEVLWSSKGADASFQRESDEVVSLIR